MATEQDQKQEAPKQEEKKGMKIPETATRAGRLKGANGKKDDAEKALDKDAERKRLDTKDEGKKESRPRESRAMDDPTRVLARRAVEIAESGGASLGSAVTAPQAQLIGDRLGKDPVAKFSPATLGQLLGYAQGGRGAGRDDVPDEALSKLRDFCRQAGSRRIWPRKVAATALALHEQATGRTIPHTKKAKPEPEPKPEPEKAKAEAK